MAFWDGLLGKKKHSFQKTEYEPLDAQAEAEETEFLRKHQLSNASLREKFIVRMLEQMKEVEIAEPVVTIYSTLKEENLESMRVLAMDLTETE